MGARPITSIVMTVTDPAGGDDAWEFSVRVPPLSAVEDLHAILAPRQKALAEMGAKISADSELAALGADMSSLQDDPHVRGIVMQRYGAEMIASMAAADISEQVKAADIVRPHCSQPRGLVDDDGAAMTWDGLCAVNEPYAVSVLWDAAEAVYQQVRGARGTAARKN